MKEIWKDIKEYEGLYQISNTGKVRSFLTNKLLKLAINHKGYKVTYLYKNGKRKTISVHRLVAINFILNPHNYPQVNHIDGNKQNNNMDNLEWCDNDYNQRHAQKNGLNLTCPIRLLKVTEQLEFNSIHEAFKYLGIKPNGKYKDVINTSRIYNGYIWEYIDAKEIQKEGIPIIQYDINYKFVKIWKSAAEASRALKINSSHIRDVCKKKRKSAGNYIWENLYDDKESDLYDKYTSNRRI